MKQTVALQQFAKELEKHEYTDGDFESKKRMIFWGVKSLGYESKETYKETEVEDKLFLYQFLTELIDQITPRQLITIFPITKEYDGYKYGMKDYFYVMKKCKEHGLDKPIKNSFEFLWDYLNRDIGEFVVNYMSTLSDATRNKTGQSLMQTYLAECGMTSYSEKNIDGKSVLVENLTFNSKGELV